MIMMKGKKNKYALYLRYWRYVIFQAEQQVITMSKWFQNDH